MAFGNIDTSPESDFGEVRAVDADDSRCWETDRVTGTATIVIPPPAPPPAPGGRQTAGPTSTPPLAKILIKGTFTRDCDCDSGPRTWGPEGILWTDLEKKITTTVAPCKDSEGNRDFTYWSRDYKSPCTTPMSEAAAREGRIVPVCVGTWNKPFNLEITADFIAGLPPFGAGFPGDPGAGTDPPQWAIDCGLTDTFTGSNGYILNKWTDPIAAACALEHIKCTDSGVTVSPPSDLYPNHGHGLPGNFLSKIIEDYISFALRELLEKFFGLGECSGPSARSGITEFPFPPPR